METNYTLKGEKGKQCKDCKHFKPAGENKGQCFGNEVSAEGSCKFFKKK